MRKTAASFNCCFCFWISSALSLGKRTPDKRTNILVMQCSYLAIHIFLILSAHVYSQKSCKVKTEPVQKANNTPAQKTLGLKCMSKVFLREDKICFIEEPCWVLFTGTVFRERCSESWSGSATEVEDSWGVVVGSLFSPDLPTSLISLSCSVLWETVSINIWYLVAFI